MAKTKRRVVAPRLDDFVTGCLGKMLSYSETVDVAMAEFGCSESTVTKAIVRVKKQWMKMEASTVIERRAGIRADIRYAVKRALEAADYRAVAQMFKVLADVEGVKAPKQIEHSGGIELKPVAAMSPQERQREIAELLAKRDAALRAQGATVPNETVTALLAVSATEPDDEDDDLDLDLAPDIRPTKGRGKPKPRVH